MSQNTKTILTVLGFALLGFGFFGLCLNFVGVDFTFMYWMKSFGALPAFLIKVGMMIIGFVLIFFGQVDLDQEEI